MSDIRTATKYDPDQPRDEAGRWTDGGGGGSAGNEGDYDIEMNNRVYPIVTKMGRSNSSDILVKNAYDPEDKRIIGTYDPNADKVIIYGKAVREYNISDDDLTGIMAHELAHKDTFATVKSYVAEEDKFESLAFTTGEPDINSLDYRTYKLLQEPIRQATLKGSFTSYSKIYYDEWQKKPSSYTRKMFIEEALAESFRMKATGRSYPKEWDTVHEKIKTAWWAHR